MPDAHSSAMEPITPPTMAPVLFGWVFTSLFVLDWLVLSSEEVGNPGSEVDESTSVRRIAELADVDVS